MLRRRDEQGGEYYVARIAVYCGGEAAFVEMLDEGRSRLVAGRLPQTERDVRARRGK
jgi:hypothetical protein